MASIFVHPINNPFLPVLEEATHDERLTTADESLDTVESHDTQPPFKSSAITKHDQPQPLPAFVREPVVHDASVPVLSNEHALLDHRSVVDRPSPQQEVQVQHTPMTNGMFPLTLMG